MVWRPSVPTLVLAGMLYAVSGLSITAGYPGSSLTAASATVRQRWPRGSTARGRWSRTLIGRVGVGLEVSWLERACGCGKVSNDRAVTFRHFPTA